ncbi:DUF6932 family protein [Streptomyces sp. C10-9-1]|uniref:DUF6932 family protein n=1 Tax=Streptomyces sp. C10-9-1 TaxID=1859285 RepID=UPI003D75AD41
MASFLWGGTPSLSRRPSPSWSEHRCFAESATRPRLWGGLVAYVDRFLALEDAYAEALGGTPLVHRLWLGGSFVSTKPDPRNIDTTVLVDVSAKCLVRGRPGSKWLTTAFQSRSRMREKFGVSPVRIGYRRVPRVFEPDRFTVEDRTYTTERGVWDDWWQRCRLAGGTDRAPSEQSAVPARGYLEVQL